MNASSKRGNNPALWDKLLGALDEKLQLGLLDYLKRINSYHFEDNILTIQPASTEDETYLRKTAVFHQLQLFAQDATAVEKVVIEKCP